MRAAAAAAAAAVGRLAHAAPGGLPGENRLLQPATGDHLRELGPAALHGHQVGQKPALLRQPLIQRSGGMQC